MQRVLRLSAYGGLLSVAAPEGNDEVSIRIDWRWPSGIPGHRFVSLSPEQQRALLDFMALAAGADYCSFCSGAAEAVTWLGQSKIGGALICDGCVSELHGQITTAARIAEVAVSS